MGYALPDSGTPYTDDLDWFLVAIPSDPAFRRAAMGAYTQLADVWMWGLEKAKTPEEKALQLDARRVWLNAINATWDNMAVLDQILASVDGVEGLLAELIAAQCCGALTTTDIPDGTGTISPSGNDNNVPSSDTTNETIPLTVASDLNGDDTLTQAERDQYICASAGFVVDMIIDMLRWTKLLRTIGGAVGQLVNWIIERIIGYLIHGLADDVVLWVIDDFVDFLATSIDELETALIDQAIANLEANRQNILCVMALEGTASSKLSAMSVILAEMMDETILAFVMGGPWLAAWSLIHNALIDTSAWQEDCSTCSYDFDDTATFDSDDEWYTAPLYDATEQAIYVAGQTSNTTASLTEAGFRTKYSLTRPYTVSPLFLQFDLFLGIPGSDNWDWSIHQGSVQLNDITGQQLIWVFNDANRQGLVLNTWNEVSIPVSALDLDSGSSGVLSFIVWLVDRIPASGQSAFAFIDNVRFAGFLS